MVSIARTADRIGEIGGASGELGVRSCLVRRWRMGMKGKAGTEARNRLVAEMALKRMSVREIAAALTVLPAKQRPKGRSPSAVGRDLKALKEEWAAARRALVDELVDEEVARLNALEGVWWPKATDVESERQGEATDKVLAIQRQRAQYLKIGPGGRAGVSVEAGAAAGGSVNTPVSAMKIRVELVDDGREA
jgi:hypothetical protein